MSFMLLFIIWTVVSYPIGCLGQSRLGSAFEEVQQDLGGRRTAVTGLPKPPYPTNNVVIGLRRFISARAQSVSAQLAQ